MNEFINKLIGELEEKENEWADTYSLSSGFDSYANGMSDGFEKAIEIVNQLAESYHIHCEQEYMRGYADAEKKLAEEYNNGWIPFTQRKLTEEEKEEMNTDFDYMLDCKLPDDNQEIIVSYKNGYVDTDTFFNDCGECYLDSGDDFIDDVVAWMPLPPAYQPKNCNNCANNTDFDEVDNGCYMCCKGIEDNYQPKGES